jgi:hypothetical protein
MANMRTAFAMSFMVTSIFPSSSSHGSSPINVSRGKETDPGTTQDENAWLDAIAQMGSGRQCSVIVFLGLNIDLSIYFDKSTLF